MEKVKNLQNMQDIDYFTIPEDARGSSAWTEDLDLAVRSFSKKKEVKCPECGNTIELDWNEEAEHECAGHCGSCGGCGHDEETENDQEEQQENNEDDM